VNQPTRWYRNYNKEYFQGLLPKVPVIWGLKMLLVAQVQYDKEWIPTKIWINNELQKWPALAATALLHEMVHIWITVAERDVYCQHGRPFMRTLRRLMNEGAFDRLL
jgi:hypothetical protein